MIGIQRRGLAWVALAALGAVTVGCAGGKTGMPGEGGGTLPMGPEGPKLVFVTNSNSDWWTAVETGMEDGGKEFGAEVSLRRNDQQAQGQINILREVLSMPDVQGVAISVIEADSPGVIDAMKELQQAGKVVITIDSDVAPEFADAEIRVHRHQQRRCRPGRWRNTRAASPSRGQDGTVRWHGLGHQCSGPRRRVLRGGR